LIFICDDHKHEEVITRIARIGYECEGYLEGGFEAWKNSGRKIDKINNISAKDFVSLY